MSRQALTAPGRPARGKTPLAPVGGFRPFASRGGVVTNEQIDHLREGDID